jgi:transposase
MRKPYPSDITREQFESIRETLESVKKRTSPRKVDLYEVFCAVLYILKTACSWRALPHDFPDWHIVYYYWSLWQTPSEKGLSILDHILADLEDTQRHGLGRKETPSMVIVDSKSIQNSDTAGEKGYDAGKKSPE